MADQGQIFSIGGDLPVNRIGFGALRITGQPGNWGYPTDVEGSIRLLQRIPELGVNFIDTADSYGPEVSEILIHRALYPYPSDLVIATKVGAIKLGPGIMRKNGRPEYLRRAAEECLRRLELDSIDLLQYHWVDPQVPLEESIGTLAELRNEGKVRHLGLCNVSIEEVARARCVAPIASVQNPYSIAERGADALIDITLAAEIAFIPYTPLVGGALAQPGGPLDDLAKRHNATAGQFALAWLLARSPNILLIPGTSSIHHLEENVAAVTVQLEPEDIAQLDRLMRGGTG